MTRRSPDRPTLRASRAACKEPRHQVSDTIAADSLAERVLRNARGDRVTLLNYGARLTRIELQLPDGIRNVILGYEDCAGYLTDPYFMGATVGRTCNRIAGAHFNLGGVDYPLDANEGGKPPARRCGRLSPQALVNRCGGPGRYRAVSAAVSGWRPGLPRNARGERHVPLDG